MEFQEIFIVKFIFRILILSMRNWLNKFPLPDNIKFPRIRGNQKINFLSILRYLTILNLMLHLAISMSLDKLSWKIKNLPRLLLEKAGKLISLNPLIDIQELVPINCHLLLINLNLEINYKNKLNLKEES